MSKETSWIALGSPAASRQNCHKLFWVNPNASIYLSKIRMVIKISCILSRKVHWQKVWWKRKWHMQKPVVSFAWWMQGIMWSAAAQAKALGNHSSVPVPGCMDCKSHKPWPCTPSALGNLLLQADKRSRSQLLRPAFQTSTPSRSAPASLLSACRSWCTTPTEHPPEMSFPPTTQPLFLLPKCRKTRRPNNQTRTQMIKFIIPTENTEHVAGLFTPRTPSRSPSYKPEQ